MGDHLGTDGTVIKLRPVFQNKLAQSTEAVEYTDCTSVEE